MALDEEVNPPSEESALPKAEASDANPPKEPAIPLPRRGKTTPRTWPVYGLEKALTVGRAIKDKNAGNPWPPTEVATALGLGSKSSSIDNLYRSSALYGITSGTRAASSITVEKIGREILYAPSPEKELTAKRMAFLNVEIFSKVLEYYKGNNLPEQKFLSNTLLNEFGIPLEFHDEFKKLFEENCRFVEIGNEWLGWATPPRSVTRT